MVVTASCGEKSDDGGSDGWYDNEEWGQSACDELAEKVCACEAVADQCETFRTYASDNAGDPEAEEYCEQQIEFLADEPTC